MIPAIKQLGVKLRGDGCGGVCVCVCVLGEHGQRAKIGLEKKGERETEGREREQPLSESFICMPVDS